MKSVKRASETNAEELEPENSERSGNSSGVVIPSDVPMGEAMDVEDANTFHLSEIGRQDVSSCQSSREFESGEHKVQMSAEKANLLELASIQIHSGIKVATSERKG